MLQWKDSAEEWKDVGCGDQLHMNIFFSFPYSFSGLTSCRVDSFGWLKSKKEEQATEPRTYASIEMDDIQTRT